MKRLLVFLCAVFLILGAVAQAQADIIFSNFGQLDSFDSSNGFDQRAAIQPIDVRRAVRISR